MRSLIFADYEIKRLTGTSVCATRGLFLKMDWWKLVAETRDVWDAGEEKMDVSVDFPLL